MSFKFSMASEAKLLGVHHDLVKVVRAALARSITDFTVVEGLRTIEKQREYFEAGKSKTMNSRHLDGHAIDLAPVVGGRVSWDSDDFMPIISAMKSAAMDLGIDIECGGEWLTFKDYPHHQLTWSKYP